MKKIIFTTTTKPFNDFFGFRQLNAIQSWLLLPNIEKEVIILTEENIDQLVLNLKNNDGRVTVLSDYEKSESSGIPTYRALIDVASQRIKNADDYICQINADMILFEDFSESLNECIDSIKEISNEKELDSRKFCLMGRRTRWKNPEQIDFHNENWENDLKRKTVSPSNLDEACAIDYFLCTEKTFSDMPQFFVARMKYDNWLVWNAISNNHFAIDITETAVSIHQDHSYGEDNNLDFHSLLNKYNGEFEQNSKLSTKFATIANCQFVTRRKGDKISMEPR